MLSFGGFAFCLSIGGRFRLALCLFSKPLLLSFGSLEFCFEVGCFCLTLFLFFDGG